MKVLAIVATLLAAANAAAALAEPAAAIERDAVAGPELVARACKASKCRCIGGQGQFCGNEAINKACTNGHVFECNKDTGNTCDYGVRDSCQKCGKLKC